MEKRMVMLKNMADVKDFVNLASRHTGNITLISGRYSVDAKSILGVFSLDTSKPIECEIEGEPTADFVADFERFTI